MRGKKPKRRQTKPDLMYNSVLVSRLINNVMKDGKKTIAEGIVYKALEDIQEKTKTKGVEALEKAINNVKPPTEVRSKRVGGSNYQVPVPVSGDRQVALALRWIIESARSNRGSSDFWQALSREIVSAYNKEGNAMKKKEEVLRMAEANKAFAQFA